MKKILFISSVTDLSVGSYRIWVHDLNQTFIELGIESKVLHHYSLEEIENHDVIICGKSDASLAKDLKVKFPEKKVGIINLSSDNKKLPVDFAIAGSLEEMDSLSCYKNVFLYPLIEKMYQNEEDCKVHEPKEKLIIGFHGHYPHLSKFNPHLKEALEELDELCDLELKIITSNVPFKWEVGKPNIRNIIIKGWNIKTFKKEMLSCDIGIVPNITPLSFTELALETSIDLGLYNTDHIVRMKNKSNAGRCFVFHQLGIPVVADFTPSNFHILGDPRCGFIAFNKNSWIKSILKLRDCKVRQTIAYAAKKEFDRLYDPHIWAKRLYNNILEI